jgi:hypothetical protein
MVEKVVRIFDTFEEADAADAPIKSYQELLEWVLPPLVIHAFEAH